MGLFQIPYQTEPAQYPEDGVADIHFPPIKSHVGRSLIVVVVIVPAFAQSDQCQKPMVSALVGRGETLLPEDMREGINGEGAVIKNHGAEEEAPG